MCNRLVQKDKVIKPGERVRVLLKGPGAEFEIEVEGVFAGAAKLKSRLFAFSDFLHPLLLQLV